MAKPVDEDAVRSSEKALTVIFILAILAANAFLVVKLLRRAGSRLLQLPQLYVLAALALGDILLALFSLSVRARSAYEEYFAPSCSTAVLANVYQYFNAFVFCIGLIIIMMLKAFLPRHFTPIALVATSLVSGGVPYLHGVIIVLPIILAGLDWSSCQYDEDHQDELLDRYRAVTALSYIVLPILALIISVVVFIYSRRLSENNYAQILNQPIAEESSILIVGHKSLIFISICTIIFYAPFALFLLGYTYSSHRSDLDPIPRMTINLFLNWFSFFRPVVTSVLFALKFIPDSD